MQIIYESVPSVGCREIAESRCSCDLEAGAKFRKSAWRQLRAASCELQQPRHLLLCEVSNGGPEPVKDAPEFCRASVYDMVRPEVCYAVLASSAQQKL